MSNVNVYNARALLARAEEEERAERRAKLKEQLAQVHKQRVQAQAEYQKIAAIIKAERTERHKLRFQIEHVDSLLGQHRKIRPAIADALPADPEAFKWMMDHTMMEKARGTLMEQLRNVPDSMTTDAMRYEGPAGLLATLEYAENNLLGQLDPAGRDAWLRGGVFAVSDI